MGCCKPIGLQVAIVVLAWTTGVIAQEKPPPQNTKEPPPGKGVWAGEYTIEGPFTHENLAIFLIHGQETLPGKQFLTLQEAVAQKKAIVHETQNVNELAVENTVSDVEVFIQSGDIVSGGRQDRILAVDLIVAPHSKVPIPAFCVEQGRWTPRGGESAQRFEKAESKAPSKDLKLAVNYRRDQRLVWREVAQAQAKLSRTLGASVRSGASASSLPLSLENKKLQEAATKYEKELGRVGDGKRDVLGYAYAVNGKVEGAEVYGSAALFRKVWPQLLQSNAVEAVAERKKDLKVAPVTVADVKAFLADADGGQAKDAKEVSNRLKVITRESNKTVCFETRDGEIKVKVIHRSYVAK